MTLKSKDSMTDVMDEYFPDTCGQLPPMPCFGSSNSPPAQELPMFESACASFTLCCEEIDLGYRVFLTAEATTRGVEIWANLESTRSDLLGNSVSVALLPERGREAIFRDIPFEPRGENNGCGGRRSFGLTTDLRAQLGNKVTMDVLMFDKGEMGDIDVSTKTS